LLKLIAGIEEGREDSRIAGSLLVGGFWFVIAAALFGHQLGASREWLLWGGWIAVALGIYLLARRKARKWIPQAGRPRRRIIDKRYF
jgi:hypothetical protein